MNSQEFLDKLKISLAGKVPIEVSEEQIRYYESYIANEITSGKREEDVIEELGEPRLLAKTIITTSGMPHHETEVIDEARTEEGTRSQFKVYTLNRWYYKALIIGIVIAIIALIVLVISGILAIVIPLLPVILVGILIAYFLRGPRQ